MRQGWSSGGRGSVQVTTRPQRRNKSPFSNPCFVLELTKIRRRVVPIKAVERVDVLEELRDAVGGDSLTPQVPKPEALQKLIPAWKVTFKFL